ncbi:MAG TPA: phage/plasmid primase, P4 family [Vulgatibacter sp.]|nr:phage/plasmid primase, P4 family [Vulgatibacter sp.]
METVNALVMDFDFGKRADSKDDALAVCEKAQALAACIVATSHNHNAKGPGDWRFRLIFPTPRSISAAERTRLWSIVNAKLGGGADPQCNHEAALFFLPSCPPERAAVATIEAAPGQLLDVDALLAEAPAPKAKASKGTAPKSRHDSAASLAGRLRNEGKGEEETLDAYRADPEISTLFEERPGELERLARNAQGWDRRYPWTDTGNAERLIDRNAGRVRYVATWGKWIIFDGKRWNLEGADLRMVELATEAARSIPEEVDAATAKMAEEAVRLEAVGEVKAAEKLKKTVEAQRKEARAWAKKAESKGALAAAVDLARAQPGVALHHDQLDADPMRLGVENGVLDLCTGELLPHTPGDLITKIVPVPFDPAAEAPTWERFVSEIMGGDADLAAYLQRAVGYSLTGEVREHALFFLHGSGANGKSTFVGTLLEAIGHDYGWPAPSNLLLASRNERHETGVASLHGRRLVSCQEVEEGRRWDESLLKALTGGDPISARKMREDHWRFAPVHKLWVSGNHKPIVKGTDNGIWRRLKLIPFEVSFLGREDRTLPERLRAELPGILRWAVEGCLAWQRDGLRDPERVRAATEGYRAEQDTLGRFLADECEEGADFRIIQRSLRAAYERWCGEEGEAHPMPPKSFNEALRARGFRDTRTRVEGSNNTHRAWAGLRLRPAERAPLQLANVGTR